MRLSSCAGGLAGDFGTKASLTHVTEQIGRHKKYESLPKGKVKPGPSVETGKSGIQIPDVYYQRPPLRPGYENASPTARVQNTDVNMSDPYDFSG